jgi:transcriptional regulator with XRE-family HTH domain
MAQAITTQRTAANLRAELARRKLTYRQVAADLGLTTSSVARRMSGATPLDVDELAKFAEYLGVPVTALLDETGAA